MLYTLLKPFVRASLKAFFRKIEVIGKENLEIKGPIIFASNHPNAFLDPILLVIIQKPQLYFLAGAEWFGEGLKNQVFRNDFNMIPVVRPWLKNGKKIHPDTNAKMFEQCYKALSEDKRIVVYPEGTSITTPKIRDLKTGTARMKLEGDEYLREKGLEGKKISVVPVGFNYYNPRTFQSDVIINVGSPVDFSDIQEKDPKDQVRKMTERIREEMSRLVFHFEEEDFNPLARKVFRIYGEKMGASKLDNKGIFLLQKTLLDVVRFYSETDPERFEETKKKIESLDKKVSESKLDLRFFGEYRFPFTLLIRLILGFPLFFAGWLLNILPYTFARWAFERFLKPKFSTTYEPGKLNPSFLGSMAFLIGMIVFLIWYILLTVGFMTMYGWWWIIPVVPVISYFLGIYAARYVKIMFNFYQQILVVNRRRRRKEIFRSIKKEREQLIEELDQLRSEYDQRQEI